MNAQVKVWNDNDYPYRENFKGTVIEIPPKKFIEMDYEDAIEFKSSFPNLIAPDFDSAGNQKKTSYKMIRVDGRPSDEDEKSEYVCMSCKDVFGSEEALEIHIDKHHLGELEDQEVADKRRKTKRAN